MSIRTTAVFEFRVDRDAAEVRTLLGWALPDANNVRAYWREQEPAFRPQKKRINSKRNSTSGKLHALADKSWVLTSRADEKDLRFWGPGGLSVWVFPGHAEIHSGCRWRGFLTIPRLRRVHLGAFDRIATVFKARELIIMPSDARAQDLLWQDGSFADAVADLESQYGPPQPSVRDLDSDGIPGAWFLEDVKYPV